MLLGYLKWARVCNAHKARQNPQGLCKAPHDSGVCWKQFAMLLEDYLVCGGDSFHPPLHTGSTKGFAFV